MNRQELTAVGLDIFPQLLVLTLACGLIYTTVQQSYRIGANDPQIQMVEDAAAAAATGAPATSLVTATIDPSTSLAPFTIVYDDSNNVVASGAKIGGQVPVLPNGVFTDVRSSGEKRFTWQTADGTRLATVVAHYSGNQSSGFILAARSLKEVEARIEELTQMTGLTWLAGLISLMALSFIRKVILPRR